MAASTLRGDPKTNLIWIDLEMTGLDTNSDTIIEVATLVTDKYLAEVAEGPVYAIGLVALAMGSRPGRVVPRHPGTRKVWRNSCFLFLPTSRAQARQQASRGRRRPSAPRLPIAALPPLASGRSCAWRHRSCLAAQARG